MPDINDMTDIHYDSLKTWVQELEQRRDAGHELLWADLPRVSKRRRGFSHQHSCHGFWDLTDNTHHIIPVPVVVKGFKELPHMEDVLRPKWLTWAIKDIERHHKLKEDFLTRSAA